MSERWLSDDRERRQTSDDATEASTRSRSERCYRFITLSDIMRPFSATAFFRVLESLHLLQLLQHQSHVSGQIESLSQAVAKLEQSRGLSSGAGAQLKDDELSDEYRRSALIAFTDMEPVCIFFELDASLVTVRKFRVVLARPNSRLSDLYPLADELRGRLIDEMESKCLWALTTKEREYYEQPRNGWDEIIARFSDSITDVEEASKCFALSRYAAAVFHSVQIVEVGLIDLGEFIGVNDPHSGWTAVSNALDKIIAKKHQDRTAFERDNFKFLEQVQGTVAGLKNAWRNKISHVQGKLVLMTKDFSPEVAEEILFATRAFMRRLAAGLPSRP
jgi:hypothetical protein